MEVQALRHNPIASPPQRVANGPIPLTEPVHLPEPAPVQERLQLNPTPTGLSQTNLSFVDASSANGRKLRFQNLIQELQGKPVGFQLGQVNDFFNVEIRFQKDLNNQGINDYWQTQQETLQRGQGDCEDYALAKFQTLRELGVPEDRLQIFYVRSVEQGAHMVLSYRDENNQTTILDNLSSIPVPSGKRGDLTPVYGFNSLGIWAAGSGNQWLGRQLKSDPKQLSLFMEWQKKVRQGQ